MRLQICLTMFLIGLLSNVLSAQEQSFKLAGVFGDHMVVQRDQEIPIWGWAKSGTEVTVSMDGHVAKGISNEAGKWMVKLAPHAAGGPFAMKISGDSELTLEDVYVGEVWMCSGQSNMAWSVKQSQNYETEKTNANFPLIRMIKIDRNSQPTIQEDCKGQWNVCSPDTVGNFSASAYFFGRKLHQELNVPIGLINSSWGGTDVAAWTSTEAQSANPALADLIKSYNDSASKFDPEKAKSNFDQAMEKWNAKKAAGENPGRRPRKAADPMLNQNRPSNLFNGMVNPVIPYGIRGAIWYQGERNAKTIEGASLYGDQLKTLIKDWRNRWGIGDFPFITVQLPNFHAEQSQPVESTPWVLVREGQAKTLQLKNTGLAITTDIGMANNIHPTNKQDVGDRLARWALGTTYGKDLIYSGPMMAFYQVNPSNGTKNGRVEFDFKYEGDGLQTSDGSKAFSGFAIAGDDQVWYEAKAYIKANSGRLVVSSDEVVDPVAVRYNWADNPNGNVVNSAGLPMAPFRTDTWEIKSDK